METDPPPEQSPVPEAPQEIAAPPAAPVSLESPAPASIVPATIIPAVPAPPAYADRSTGLVVFGVFQIILALISASMVPFAALGIFMSRLAPGGGGLHPGRFLSGISVYAFGAAVLLSLGIGSIQAKRWARALTLVISWYWLVSGALGTVLLTAILPMMMRSILQAQQNAAQLPPAEMSTGVMAVMLTVIIVFAAFFLVVVPIAFIVFYGRNDVAETCRHRDPVERWTDRTPLPVLGASVVLTIHALYLLLSGLTLPMFPFFGRYLSGVVAIGCFLLMTGLDAYFAVAFFQLKSAGWWLAAFVTPIRLLSMAITYARTDMMQAYSKMGMSDNQLRLLNSSPLTHSHVTLWWNLLSVVILYGYLLWLKRYFKTPSTPAQLEVSPVHVG